MSGARPVKEGGKKRKSVDDYAADNPVDFVTRFINKNEKQEKVLVCRFCCQTIGARSDRIREHLATKRHQKLKLDALRKAQKFGENMTRVLPEPTGRNQLREYAPEEEERRVATPVPVNDLVDISTLPHSGVGMTVHRHQTALSTDGNRNERKMNALIGGTRNNISTGGSVSSALPVPKDSSVDQLMQVRYNTLATSIYPMFSKFLTQEHFVDVTLWCGDGETIKCHKMILAAFSTYFEKVLTENPNSNPIIFLKDIRSRDMRALVELMYRGEVSVYQSALPNLLRAAKDLQIKAIGSPVDESGEVGNRNDHKDVNNSPGTDMPKSRENHKSYQYNSVPNSKTNRRNGHASLAIIPATAVSDVDVVNTNRDIINDRGSYPSFSSNPSAALPQIESENQESTHRNQFVKRRKKEIVGRIGHSNTNTTDRSPFTSGSTMGSEIEEHNDVASESEDSIIAYEREEYYNIESEMQEDQDNGDRESVDPVEDRATRVGRSWTMPPQVTVYQRSSNDFPVNLEIVKREVTSPETDDYD